MLANSYPFRPPITTPDGFEIAYMAVDSQGEFTLSLERATGDPTWTVEFQQPGILSVSGAAGLRDALTELLATAEQLGIDGACALPGS